MTTYTTTKSEVLADIGIAVMGAVFIQLGFDGDGYLYKFATLWGGMCAGYLVTVYLNGPFGAAHTD